MKNTYDLIIIGGGITGMTAAIYAARANLSTLILEKQVCGGLVNTTHVVENFPSYPSIGGMDLMEKVRNHVDALGVSVIEVVEVIEINLKSDVKAIETDEGVFSAPAVIIATGRTPKKLSIETDCEQIHYCAICDGSAYKGKDVIVVGGGNSGVDESLYLLNLGVEKILLIEEMDRLFASESAVKKLSACAGVEMMTSTKIESIDIDTRLQAVTLLDMKNNTRFVRKTDGIFVYIGQSPQTDMFRDQIHVNDAGYIPVDADMKTNIDGVFAAGDVTAKKYRQITTAMGDATIAALSAVECLTAMKTCRALS